MVLFAIAGGKKWDALYLFIPSLERHWIAVRHLEVKTSLYSTRLRQKGKEDSTKGNGQSLAVHGLSSTCYANTIEALCNLGAMLGFYENNSSCSNLG